MRADYIQEIVKKFEELPYECILFDGEWGIGKTYAINEALKKQEHVCRISMFGLQSSQHIYHEVLFQLVLKNSKAGKVGEFANDVLTGISSIWESISQAKEALQNVVKEKEMFLLLSKSFKELHIIVIDDLERISADLKLEEVMGIVETLKGCCNVKVVLVANSQEMRDNKEAFEKYSEKVIDRVYHITEKPQNIKWESLGINAEFISDFLAIHNVKNLRTLQKAQKFYEDVKGCCSTINTDEFWSEVRLICFAIVVESLDNLYYQTISEENRDKGYINKIEHRVSRYLKGVKISGNSMELFLKYYNNEIILRNSDFEFVYNTFVQAGEKKNYYKSDMEIKNILPEIAAKINDAKNLIELNSLANEYVVWSDIVGVDNSNELDLYKNKLHDILLETSIKNDNILGSYTYDLWHLESDKLKQIYREESEKVKRQMIEELIEYLKENTSDDKAYEYSYRLRGYLNNSYYRNMVKEEIDCL